MLQTTWPILNESFPVNQPLAMENNKDLTVNNYYLFKMLYIVWIVRIQVRESYLQKQKPKKKKKGYVRESFFFTDF